MKNVGLKQKLVIVLFALALCFGMIGFSFETVTNAASGDYFVTTDENAYLNCSFNQNVVGLQNIAADGMQSATSVYGKTEAGEVFLYNATTCDTTVSANANRKDLSYESAAVQVHVYIYDSTLQDGESILGKGEIKVGIASDVDGYAENWGDYRYWKNTVNTWDGNKLYNAKWNTLTLGVEWMHSNASGSCWMSSANEIAVFSIQIPNLGGTTHVLIGDIKMTTGTDASISAGDVVKYDEFMGPKFDFTGSSQNVILGSEIIATLTATNISSVTDLSVKATYNGTEQTFTQCPATVSFTPETEGDYIVKFDVSYTFEGETVSLSKERTYSVFQLDTSKTVDINSTLGIDYFTSYVSNGQTAELTIENVGFRTYENQRYVYAKSQGLALKYGFMTEKDVYNKGEGGLDVSSVNEQGYGAIVFNVWVNKDVSAKGLIAMRSDCWYSAADNATISSFNLQGGKLQQVVLRMSDFANFDFKYFTLLYLQIDSSDVQALFSDAKAIVTTKATGVYDAVEFTPDFTAPEFEFGTYGGAEENAQNLAISTQETNYTATATIIKGNSVISTLNFTDADMASVLGAIDLSSGTYMYKVEIIDACGNAIEKETTIIITGEPVFILDEEGVSEANKDFEIILDWEDFGGVSELSIVVSYENVTSETYTSLPLTYTINHAKGEVEVTFAISYKYNGATETVTKTQNVTFVDTSVKFELTKNYTIENYTTYQSENAVGDQWAWLTELNQGFRYFNDQRFIYVKSNGAAVRLGHITAKNVLLPEYEGTIDISEYNNGFGAFSFYVWSDKDVTIEGRNILVASRNDVWYNNAHNAKSSKSISIQGGKLQQVIVLMSDFVNTFEDNKFDYAKFAMMYLQVDDNEANMLFSDFEIITTLNQTGVYGATDFTPDLTAPAMSAPTNVSGEYNAFVGILPVIEESTVDYSVVAEIYYNGQVAQTITAAKSELATKLGEYAFATGGTYTVEYTLIETESKNFSTLTVEYTITGKNSQLGLTLNADDFATEYYEDSTISFENLKVYNWLNQSVDFTVTVTDANNQTVTLESGAFVGQKGTYTIKVTATSGDYSLDESITVTVVSIDEGNPDNPENPDNPDNPENPDKEEKSGCGSSVSVTNASFAIVFAVIVACAFVFIKRSERKN